MWLRLVLVLVALLWPTPGHAASYAEIVRQFDAIAFSDEGRTRVNRFDRWPQGRHIRVRIVGGEPASDLLLEVMSQLTALSGVRMTIDEPANVTIEYVGQECRVQSNGFRATIRISRSSALATAHCTLEELTQLIGPMDDACHYRPSIFCDPDFPVAYTEADKIILRTTFDPRLRNGMTREEGMPLARQIIRELYEERYGPIPKEEERGAQREAETTDSLSLP